MYSFICSTLRSKLFWNARGMGNPISTGYLRQLISKHFIHVCIILEPVVHAKHIRKFPFFCGRNNWLENQSIGGNIWIMWRDNVHVEPMLITGQMITVKANFNTNICYISAVYAHCLYTRRRDLWASLVDLHPAILEPWIWGGEFNIIWYPEERSGGARPRWLSMREFNACIDACAMRDMPTSGTYFTWCNGRIDDRCLRQRLDHVLLSDRALFVGGFDARVLHRECLDHAHILCSWNIGVEESPRRWCFLWAWCNADG